MRPMDDYARIDANVRLEMTARLAMHLTMRNALDASYSEVPGYITPGRRLSVALRAAF